MVYRTTEDTGEELTDDDRECIRRHAEIERDVLTLRKGDRVRVVASRATFEGEITEARPSDREMGDNMTFLVHSDHDNLYEVTADYAGAVNSVFNWIIPYFDAFEVLADDYNEMGFIVSIDVLERAERPEEVGIDRWEWSDTGGSQITLTGYNPDGEAVVNRAFEYVRSWQQGERETFTESDVSWGDSITVE